MDSDIPANTFTRVKLTTLPGTGTLAVDDTPAIEGQFVSVLPGAAGSRWRQEDTGMGYGSAVASSADGLRLAVVGPNEEIRIGVYEDDGGRPGYLWTSEEDARNWQGIASSADGTKLAAVVGGGNIYTSDDGGDTWTPRDQSRDWKAIASSADGTKLVAAVENGYLYTSSDSGETWAPQEQERDWTAVSSSANGTRLAAVENSGFIYTSDDSGITWTPRETERTWSCITSSADGSRLAAAVLGGYVYTSADFGATWKERDFEDGDWSVITSSADGQRLTAAVEGWFTFTSKDGGETWEEEGRKEGDWQAVASSADGSRLVGVLADGSTFTSVGRIPDVAFTAPETGPVSFTFQVEDDGVGENFDLSPNTLTFEVTPNTATTEVTLSPAAIDENNAPNAWVGYLAATDVDGWQYHTYELVAGAGDTDNAAFSVSGSVLLLNGSADFETQNSYSIRVRATDDGLPARSHDEILTITVNDLPENQIPTFSGYAFSTAKNTQAQVATAKILARAADADGGTLSLTSVSSSSSQGGSAALSGSNVTYTPANNYTGLDNFTVTISDGQGGSVVGIITVNVTSGSGEGKNQAKISVLPGSNVALLFQGIPSQSYAIQRSTDMIIWSTVTTVIAAADGTIPYTDTNPPPGGSAFYRTAIPQND